MFFLATPNRYSSVHAPAFVLHSRIEEARGVSTVEFALIAPLLLAFIFTVIFLGHTYLARVSLSTAVGAVRTGYTRGELSVFSPSLETIPSIGAFKTGGGNKFVPPPALATLLASDDLNGIGAGQAFGAAGTYSTMLNATYGSPGLGLKDVSETKLYTLVFVNQMMAQSIGPSLRYPCKERGCLDCKFIPDPLVPSNPDTNFTGIECTYRPSNVFLDPVLNLLSLASGGLVDLDIAITRSRVFQSY